MLGPAAHERGDRDGPDLRAGDRPGDARHRLGRRRRAGHGRFLGLHQLRHLVAAWASNCRQPLIDRAGAGYNFTNEGGVGGTIRFLKNIMGLWLVQECRRAWERAGKNSAYDELTRLAGRRPRRSAASSIPTIATFLLPASMPAAIARLLPQDRPAGADRARRGRPCALESLALRIAGCWNAWRN